MSKQASERYSHCLTISTSASAVALTAGVIGCLVLVVIAFAVPAVAARAWLVAVLFWIGVPLGALFLLLAHALTGGRWGEAAAPQLMSMAQNLPLFFLLFIPVAATLPLLYPWAGAAADVRAPVAHLYLDPSGYILRAAAIILLGSGIAYTFAVNRRPRPLVAGFGFAALAIAFSFVAIDWFLSGDPHFGSSAFPAELAAIESLAALSVLAIGASETLAPEARDDLGQVMLAVGLGLVYLVYISYLVDWAGNLPDKAHWYNVRWESGLARGLFYFALVFGVVSLCALVSGRLRRSGLGFRVIGAFVFAALLALQLWIMLPGFGGGWAQLAACLIALLAVGGLSVATMTTDAVPFLFRAVEGRLRGR